MQIISGIAGGVAIDVPAGLAVRPTPDRVRKAIFDSLAPWDGRVVYDLFAGSGAMGLEAASRGASAVTFIESSPQHCKFIRQNIDRLTEHNVTAKMSLLCSDATMWLKKPGLAFPDIVFADPPYAISGQACKKLLENDLFISWLRNGMMIWELPSEQHSYIEFMEMKVTVPRTFRKFGNINFMLLNCR